MSRDREGTYFSATKSLSAKGSKPSAYTCLSKTKVSNNTRKHNSKTAINKDNSDLMMALSDTNVKQHVRTNTRLFQQYLYRPSPAFHLTGTMAFKTIHKAKV